MNKRFVRKAASIALVLALIAAPAAVFADSTASADSSSFGNWFQSLIQRIQQFFQGEVPSQSSDLFEGLDGQPEFDGQKPQMGQMPGQMGSSAQQASEASEIQTSGLTSNSAEELTADYSNAETIVMSDENNQVTIKESGTYIVTGTCSDGNITVKKGTQDVVLILKDLDLTSTTGAALSLNKGTETKVVIEGNVTLTDAEDLADEETDDFDGAVIKAKAGSSTVLTGTGTLNVNGNCKNGIKVSGTDADDTADGYGDASFVIDGSLTINVTAANDGINSGTDLTIKSGTITVAAGDDGIKADYILTIGEEGTDGPVINITKSAEGLEGAVVNIYSGDITVNASDDGINAANSDLSGYTFSINIMGGTVNISSGADGLDSNGNVNITGGLTTIVKAASNGGEGGLDYQGSCYIADGCFVNPYGTTMDSGMGNMGGQMNGGFGGQQPDSNSGASPQMPSGNDQGQMGQPPQGGHGGHGQFPGGMNGQIPEEPQN
jgi:hypothetical protein